MNLKLKAKAQGGKLAPKPRVWGFFFIGGAIAKGLISFQSPSQKLGKTLFSPKTPLSHCLI